MPSPTLSRCIISTETPAVRPALHHPIANYTRMEYGWPTSGSEFTALYRSIRRHKRSVMITAQINRAAPQRDLPEPPTIAAVIAAIAMNQPHMGCVWPDVRHRSLLVGLDAWLQIRRMKLVGFARILVLARPGCLRCGHHVMHESQLASIHHGPQWSTLAILMHGACISCLGQKNTASLQRESTRLTGLSETGTLPSQSPTGPRHPIHPIKPNPPSSRTIAHRRKRESGSRRRPGPSERV